jgi:hypothetical protein
VAIITHHEAELATAVEHVARPRIIALTKKRVATLKAKGHSVEMHEQTLKAFEATLQSFDDHEHLLRAIVAQEDDKP